MSLRATSLFPPPGPDRAALRRHTRFLPGLAGATPHQEVRWHLAQILPALVRTLPQRRRLRAVLTGCLADRSAIVRTMAMQGLCQLAEVVPAWRPAVRSRLEQAVRMGTPAMRARGRILLASLTPSGAARMMG